MRIMGITQQTAASPAVAHGRATRLDALIVCLVALVIGLGGYGMYDLVMAPQSIHVPEPGGGSTRGRRSTGGLLRPVIGGASELCPGRDQVSILILGTDEHRGYGRADTIMVVMINKQTKRAAAISIPRDLMVRYGRRYQKINAVFAINLHKGMGEIMTLQTVSAILGVPIDYYLKTDVSGFAKLFDALGGLDIDVDRNMYWNDSVTDLHINLRKGRQHLDGKQIEGFVRHRRDNRYGDSSDHERNQRQQYVLKELIRQKGKTATATRLPGVVNTIQDMLATNMAFPELVALGLLAKDVKLDEVITRVVPYRARQYNGGWYAQWKPTESRKMMAEVQLGLSGGRLPADTDRERNPEIGG